MVTCAHLLDRSIPARLSTAVRDLIVAGRHLEYLDACRAEEDRLGARWLPDEERLAIAERLLAERPQAPGAVAAP